MKLKLNANLENAVSSHFCFKRWKPSAVNPTGSACSARALPSGPRRTTSLQCVCARGGGVLVGVPVFYTLSLANVQLSVQTISISHNLPAKAGKMLPFDNNCRAAVLCTTSALLGSRNRKTLDNIPRTDDFHV